MFNIILQEIKSILSGGKKVFICSILAFTCACVAINVTLTNFANAQSEQTSAEESYGNKLFYKLILDGEEEIYHRVFGEENLINLKNAFTQLKSDSDFQYRYTAENIMDFWSLNDETYGEDDFPPYKHELLDGYESGEAQIYEDCIKFKAFYVDNLFQNEPNVALSDGQWFSHEDFYVNDSQNITLPIVLGNSYKDIYKIGDEYSHAHLGTIDEIKVKVVGFLEKDSYFYDNNNVKQILNRYMIVPAVETTYNSVDDFAKASYDSFKMTNTRIVFDKEKEADVVKKVYEILSENKLYEFRLFNETGGAEKIVTILKSDTIMSLTITAFIVVLLFAIFCIQTYYKLLKNKKKYSTLILNGITKPQLFIIIIIETLLVFALSTVLFYLLYKTFYTNPHIDMGLSHYTFIIIPIIETVLLFFMGVFGCYKVSRFNLSSSLREHE